VVREVPGSNLCSDTDHLKVYLGFHQSLSATISPFYEGESENTSHMDVIGFLCVSLGSSTVQLRDSLGSRRSCANSEGGFCSQNGGRV
jgi:hypothetical protein